jgi:DNA-directed RNA polymerase subunit RPC12/RpoP
MTLYCPACGGRVRVEHVSVTIEGDLKTTVIEGVCEKCGAKYTLTKRLYLVSELKWRAGHPEPAIAR